MNLPDVALAVRQPWAWAIIHGVPPKDIENRFWAPQRSGWRFRGRVAILASQGMTQDEYAQGRETIDQILGEGTCPLPHELIRGAIVGSGAGPFPIKDLVSGPFTLEPLAPFGSHRN